MRRGRLLLAALALAMPACRALVGGDGPADRAALFDLVWRDLDRHYSFFELKGIDWDSLGRVYRPQAAAATSDADLAAVIGAMLAELRDIHVNLYTPGVSYRYTGYDARPTFFSIAVVRAYVPLLRQSASGNIAYGQAAPGIGYVRMPSFGGKRWSGEMDAVLGALDAGTGLIVDVRGNGGGSTDNSLAIAGRFADRARVYGTVRFRGGPRHTDFTTPRDQPLRPAGIHYAGPVILLTDRADFSSTEDFVLALRVVPTVTVLGDTTGGGSGNPLIRELPNVWTYRFSQWIEYGPDGTTHEEVGLAPDVEVRGSAPSLQSGIDEALAAAILRLQAGQTAPRAGGAR